MKKILSIVLTLALLVSLVPFYGTASQAEAAGSYFLFPNEKDQKTSPRIVSSKNVSLTGTINGIVGTSISYKVQQVTASSDDALNSTQDISTGITTSGNNTITVSNVELFPGLNKITFKGIAGTSIVEEHIYIEYRDSPTLNDLEILFENKSYTVAETGVTMLYSNEVPAKAKGNITIVGKAPNATRVIVEVNKKSYEFSVAGATSNYRFSTSQLEINKGMNTITFKVSNGGQVIETTRLVSLYNGEVTYYDEKITSNGVSNDVVLGGEYSVKSTDVKLSGKAVIPMPLYDIAAFKAANAVDNTVTIEKYKLDVTDKIKYPDNTALITAIRTLLQANMSIAVSGITPTVTLGAIEPTVINADSKYLTIDYSYNISNLSYDTPITFKYTGPNLTQYNVSDERKITLRNSTLPFIADINYLSGFDSTMTTNPSDKNYSVVNNKRILTSLEGVDIGSSGVDVYSIPMAVEILIANQGNTSDKSITDLIKAEINGKSYGIKVISDSSGNPITEQVEQIVNGVPTTYLRVFVEFAKLDKSGTNNVAFWLDADPALIIKKNYIFKLQYGPYVKYENIVDGMSIPYNSLDPKSMEKLIKSLGGFAGRIMNVANSSDINYPSDDATSPKQTVFLYLNNVAIEINSYDPKNPHAPLFSPKGITVDDKGELVDIENELDKAGEIAAYLNKAGENTLKFVFYTSTYSYESTMKFSIVPTNLPTIPAEKTDGVYPYTTGTWPPVPADSKFTYNSSTGVYTTKEADFNVYGTFDFIDLAATDTAIDDILKGPGRKVNPADYVVTISNPNWNKDIDWDLTKQFKFTDGKRNIEKLGNNSANGDRIYNSTADDASTPYANVTFYYDVENENFFFDISNQSMPSDGSPLVYVISVFNAGKAGPRATYRLEINPVSIPYSIKSPVEEERITNKNYVEFIISSPGADSVVVDKQVAEKVEFLDYKDGTTKILAYRVIVTGLKANSEKKIPFTITRGDTKITDSITVKYVPTNIPGAQYLEPMKNSHKVFNNALSLTFPKNTNLIRSEFNKIDDHATQVYTGHQILFAIANPDDGIVDRHLYEGQVGDYTATSKSLGLIHMKNRFEDLAGRYIKASPLFWVDAGLADNPETTKYDSIAMGLDPFPFPNTSDKYDKNFTTRYKQYDRELIPSSVGSLTLTYDPSIVATAGTTITVFRFDPVEQSWENIGGVVDTKKGTITVPFTKFGYYVVAKLTRSYNDIIDHNYAREPMEAIYAKGIMNAADPVSQFGGDRYVTRGEFTRMIVKALELPLNYAGSLHFTYYPETITNANNAEAMYDYRYIETAARAGIVNGTRPGFFDEDVQLSRQDASVILTRALELKLETDSKKAKAQLDKAFKDGGNFDFYAIPSVLAIQKKGFIVGKPISSADPKQGFMFDPKARMLRSDAAIIMARVMADQKKLPTIYN